MSPAQLDRDRTAEAAIGPLCGDPLLVVSILDGSMEHASVHRRLRAALSALDHADDEGVLLLDGAGGIGFASRSARRILSDFFDRSAVRLPERIADCHAKAIGTLVIATDGSTLFVEAKQGGSALRLSANPSCAGKLTARERDVMRCVADGLSNAEIARRLWIQPSTIRKDLEHVFAKLGVGSRTAALSMLHASGAEAS